MANLEIQALTFRYPGASRDALKDINLSFGQGEFVLLCGASGSGKTTLLRHLKPALTPNGECTGAVLLDGGPFKDADPKLQASAVGLVMQNPDSQMVSDRVWHELAFGLESLGFDEAVMRRRVAEITSFFGLTSCYRQKISELSGGMKQMVALAAVMVTGPDVLLLDEPTAQLDPLAAEELFRMLEKINRELGTTILVTEQRLDGILPLCARVVVMDEGEILLDTTSRDLAKKLREREHPMVRSLPAPVRIGAALDPKAGVLTVRDGQELLDQLLGTPAPRTIIIPPTPEKKSATRRHDDAITLSEVWFRYDYAKPDVLKNLTLALKRGKLTALLGANGAGKTTLLRIAAGLTRPVRGRVQAQDSYRAGKTGQRVAMLPQSPLHLFSEKTVWLDLLEAARTMHTTRDEYEGSARALAEDLAITELLERHPYDLSGGEIQRAALCKLLLTNPTILLLDEPTKGMDGAFKETLAALLTKLREDGVTILMASHDVEFCADVADHCALLFDGEITAEDVPSRFFAGNLLFTTAANRTARRHFPDAITPEEVIAACKHHAEPDPA